MKERVTRQDAHLPMWTCGAETARDDGDDNFVGEVLQGSVHCQA